MARAAAPWGARASAVRDRREAECHGAAGDGRGLKGAAHCHNDPDRLDEVNLEISDFGCQVVAQYSVLGSYDFIIVLEAPDSESDAHLSVALGSRGTVNIVTVPVIPMAERSGRNETRKRRKAFATAHRVSDGLAISYSAVVRPPQSRGRCRRRSWRPGPGD
jgi:uncharacterized protein with GYD domain